MTSQPEPQLRASSMNALAHGADSLYTPFANPVSRMTALRGAELIAAALDEEPGERDRAALALGSILCGYAIDSGLFALHHVICQTLVRVCGIPHAETNAAILPRAMAAMRDRAPEQIAALAAALGTDARTDRRPDRRARPPAGARRRRRRPRPARARRSTRSRPAPSCGFTPDPPGREELRRIVEVGLVAAASG